MNTQLEIKAFGNQLLSCLQQDCCALPWIEIAEIAEGWLCPFLLSKFDCWPLGLAIGNDLNAIFCQTPFDIALFEKFTW